VQRRLLAIAAGVLVQAALLAAISGMPPHHPARATTVLRVLAVGAVGGFVAGVVADAAPDRIGAVAGAVGGLGVGAGFWWQVLYSDTVGVFHHVHYALATTPELMDVAPGSPHLIAAFVGVLVALTATLGGLVGGRAACEWPRGS
jgi:hypothetical protein